MYSDAKIQILDIPTAHTFLAKNFLQISCSYLIVARLMKISIEGQGNSLKSNNGFDNLVSACISLT